MTLRKITFFLSGMLLASSASAQILGSSTWTWMKGTDTTNRNGIYGVQGVPAAANNPGGRDASGTWTDSAGKFWLFGGVGRHATGTSDARLNDLWRYDPVTNEWTWMHGDTLGNVHGVYGTKGVADPANKPGARYRVTTWTDTNGNFWLFGGQGRGASGAVQQSPLNDLWRYDVASNSWTWVSGDNAHYINGVFGVKGQPNAANKPGTKEGAAGWMDKEGNLWLFGGLGRSANSTSDGVMNDMWKYNPRTDVWTWMHGDSIITPDSVYGVKGVAHAANKPAARRYAATWTDSAGNFWLFGGQNRSNHSFNDLWKFNVATNEWTWVSGDSSVNQFGNYTVPMVSDPSNKPGSRISATSWQGPEGYLWLFGGSGYASFLTGSGSFPVLSGYLNDLWLYDISENEWTWVSGDSIFSVNGIYGTQGVPDQANKPGTRYLASGGWIDDSGDIWLFGGSGRGRVSTANGKLHDMWRFDACFLIAPIEGIVGADTICRNTEFTYSIPPVAHAAHYIWTLPNGWTGSSSTNTITVNVGTTGGIISVQAENDCDTGQIQSLNVFVPQFISVEINVDSIALSTAATYATYQWYKNGDSIPGATQPVYLVTENASYTVKVADIYGCEDSSRAYVVNNVSVPYMQTGGMVVSVFPNPARSTVHIDAAEPVSISLSSLDGRRILHRTSEQTIDISHLAEGIYVLQVRDLNGRLLHTEKLVKVGAQ